MLQTTTKPRRTRRTKAQMAAARASQNLPQTPLVAAQQKAAQVSSLTGTTITAQSLAGTPVIVYYNGVTKAAHLTPEDAANAALKALGVQTVAVTPPPAAPPYTVKVPLNPSTGKPKRVRRTKAQMAAARAAQPVTPINPATGKPKRTRRTKAQMAAAAQIAAQTGPFSSANVASAVQQMTAQFQNPPSPNPQLTQAARQAGKSLINQSQVNQMVAAQQGFQNAVSNMAASMGQAMTGQTVRPVGAPISTVPPKTRNRRTKSQMVAAKAHAAQLKAQGASKKAIAAALKGTGIATTTPQAAITPVTPTPAVVSRYAPASTPSSPTAPPLTAIAPQTAPIASVMHSQVVLPSPVVPTTPSPLTAGLPVADKIEAIRKFLLSKGANQVLDDGTKITDVQFNVTQTVTFHDAMGYVDFTNLEILQ